MEIAMRLGRSSTVSSFVLAVVLLLTGLPVMADGIIGHPVVTPAGTFGGIAYSRYDGLFEGSTSTGAYRVPYRITVPADPRRSNRTVVVEPPHFAMGLGSLSLYLRPDLLFPRGFVHAGVGWSTASFGPNLNMRILDPTMPGAFIAGGVPDGNGRTDDEIIVDFARALSSDPVARLVLGRVERRYLVGFSDSSDAVLRLITSGRAADVFDFALPFIASGWDAQAALGLGLFTGKIIVVDSEFDDPTGLRDRGGVPHQYRFYVVAGTPHRPDPLDVASPANKTTPASYAAALRAHFLQGHRWVEHGTQPPPSTHLQTARDGTYVRDPNGNALTANMHDRTVPRLPFVELGEARFISDFFGSYDGVRTIYEMGFRNHRQYLDAFYDKLSEYVKADYMLEEDAEVMRRRARLCPPLTFTETYRDYYASFVAVTACVR